MKRVIIGVSGPENKPPKYLLKKWWKDAIKDGFNRKGLSNQLPEFELVYWADILYETHNVTMDKNRYHYF